MAAPIRFEDETAITAFAWIPRGAFVLSPPRVELREEEIALARTPVSESETKASAARKRATEDNGGFTFDSEDEDEAVALGAGSLLYHRSNADDKYITVPDEEDVDDIEGFDLDESDMLLLVARTSIESLSKVEVFCYEEAAGHAYYHHDMVLEDFPVCIAWSPFAPSGEPGSFVAVGSFAPQIEIFNCDVVDVIEPTVALGGRIDPTSDPRHRKLKTRSEALVAGSHARGGVLALDWNPHVRHVLASGGADTLAKLWDVTTQQCLYSFDHHSNKVCAVRWNPVEAHVLLTASYDRTAAIVDVRQQKFALCAQMVAAPEAVAWDCNEPTRVLVGGEDGSLSAYDARAADGAPIWRIQAHPVEVSSLAVSAAIPGLVVTGSHDKTLRVWDVLGGGEPVLVATGERLQTGPVFAATLCPDSPFILACGGAKGVLRICDLTAFDGVREHFGPRAQASGVPFPAVPEGIMGRGMPDSDEDDDEDDEGRRRGGDSDSDESGSDAPRRRFDSSSD